MWLGRKCDKRNASFACYIIIYLYYQYVYNKLVVRFGWDVAAAAGFFYRTVM